MNETPQFTGFARLLHALMAVMVVAMLFIGVAMVASLSDYHSLVELHKPLGLAILLLALVRLGYRWRHPAPALPDSVPSWQQFAALVSHILLYALMLALPLLGWAMLSAGGYPVVIADTWTLPALVPHNVMLYAFLRRSHGAFAYLLFATVLAHLGAALLHALIHRDGVFDSMVSWRRRDESTPAD